MTEIVPAPRFAAKAFTSSVAGCVNSEATPGNTIVADGRVDGVGIGVGTTGTTGGVPAIAGRGGGPACIAGDGPAAVTPSPAAGAAESAAADIGAARADAAEAGTPDGVGAV